MGDDMRLICLQSKDVINASTGTKIGFVVDVELDVNTLCMEALIVERFSPFKFLCLSKGPPTMTIPVCHIITIGEDVIIVNVEC